MPIDLSRGQLITLACVLLGGAALFLSLGEPGAFWSRTLGFAVAMQRELHQGLAEAMRAIREGNATAFASLIGVGFLYGVFHAVGPGHGKVVISTYLATHESRLPYGIALSFLASLLQGLTAIVLVGGAALVIGRSMRDTRHLATLLEVGSYTLVVLLGLYLIWRSARRLYLRTASILKDHEHQSHAAGDGSVPVHAHSGCGHGHGPTSADLAAEPSVREFVMTLLSVGLRPCSGSILVLTLSAGLNLLLAGVATVTAISIGTGITVSGLAVLSVYARRAALTLAGHFSGEGRRIADLFDVTALMGGILIVLLGVTLVKASQAIAQHPLV